MYAHKIIEDLLHGDQYYANFRPSDKDLLVRMLRQSVKFLLDVEHYPAVAIETFREFMRGMRLPAPLSYFEVPTLGALLAAEAADGRFILLHFFYRKGEGEWFIAPMDAGLAIDREQGEMAMLGSHAGFRAFFAHALPEREMDLHRRLVFGLPTLMVQCLMILNCTNVETVDNPPSEALNKKRIRNGKEPIYSYKTLHIKVPQEGVRGRANGVESFRVGPRLHFRRGHIRRIAEDRTIWVSATMVGHAGYGAVHKDYRITAANPM